jgi:hypothetical protein
VSAEHLEWTLSMADGDQAHGASKPTADLRYSEHFADERFVYLRCDEPEQADLGRVVLVSPGRPAFSQRANPETGWMEFSPAVGGPEIYLGRG